MILSYFKDEIKNYFHPEINQRKPCSKKLSKYFTAFHYIDKILIILSATSGGVSLATGIIKKLLSITRNKKKKHDKILMLAKSKLDSVETLVSQALDVMEISHGEFNEIIRGKQKYERMKENVKNVSEKQENLRLNSVN